MCSPVGAAIPFAEPVPKLFRGLDAVKEALLKSALTAVFLVVALATASSASDWSQWRGPERNGTSSETGLISNWSPDGTNLLWRAPFTGRSTPVVFDGKVCANGRTGEGITRQEMVACFDAVSGAKLWEHRFNVYHTTVPWNRVGWANLAADEETGYLYVQGVGGMFLCLDGNNGEVVWSRNLVEDFGFMEGYGGRTQTPLVDGANVIVHFSNTSWGSEGRPLHRLRAFDKRTGELLWVSQPANTHYDKNAQSTPNVMEVDGRRLIVAGNGGGAVVAVEASTGEPVWLFQLSRRAINTSVVVDGTTVYAAHSEENVDEPTMGRVVAIDGTGSGDVTTTHEIWRAPIGIGFSSPALAGDRLYVMDNSSKLYALDAADGTTEWELRIGRVGKASPVVADGKLYVTEVNGHVAIVGLGESGPTVLDNEEVQMPSGGRYAEIYGSLAIADGRIYFTTEEGLYCLGKSDAMPAPHRTAAPRSMAAAASAGPAVRLRVMPAETVATPGEPTQFRVHAYDAKGHDLGPAAGATWSLAGLEGSVDDSGRFTPQASALSQAGLVHARIGELEADGRVRVLQNLPIREDFESSEVDSRPDYMMGYIARWQVKEQDGNKVMFKGPSPIKIHRHIGFLGKSALSDYTIAADVMGTQDGRHVPDFGLINSGYTLEIRGAHQELMVFSWGSALRMSQEVPFTWKPDVWYRMIFRVEVRDGKGLVRGKVWPRGEAEPEAWTITVEDPLPIEHGAPGLSGFSPAPIYYDNIEVTSN
jgi:outer membrane protein assembly factor BamB